MRKSECKIKLDPENMLLPEHKIIREFHFNKNIF